MDGGVIIRGGEKGLVTHPSTSENSKKNSCSTRLIFFFLNPDQPLPDQNKQTRTHTHTHKHSILSDQERTELRQLCGRTLYHSLQTAVRPRGGRGQDAVFVATGDIDDMWIRDSSVQLSVYFPRVARRPALRRVLEGAIRTQAFLILQDPYANAYSADWRDASKLPKSDRVIGRGGWVATRNYELDSGAYFLNMLWNYHRAQPKLFGAERFLNDTELFDAAMLLVKTWTVEQNHEESSPYRYSELPRGGKGPLSAFTGMSWSGYRPSDDPQEFGFNVPVNMYAAGALERALEINAEVWRSADFAREASRLAGEIRAGIEAHGVVEVAADDGVTKTKMYAYEVDGLGGVRKDFDDPNVPSLLSIPLLGYPHFDPEIYQETRNRIMSSKNEHYFEGSVLTGLGSPHTPRGYVWPLAVMVDALTSDDAEKRANALRSLLKAQCGNGLMHESVHHSEGTACTREWFEWANAIFVVLYEDTLKERCDAEAEGNRLAEISRRETGAAPVIPGVPAAASNDPLADPLLYESLEAQIHFMP